MHTNHGLPGHPNLIHNKNISIQNGSDGKAQNMLGKHIVNKLEEK